MSGPILDLANFTFKSDELYSQSIVTDFKIGEICINTPMNIYGGQDYNRQTIFLGRTNLNINGNNVPIQFKIEAADLQEALIKFPEGVKAAVDRLHSQSLRHALAQPPRNSNLDLSKAKS